MYYFNDDERAEREQPLRLAPKHVKNKYQTGNVWKLQGALLEAFAYVQEWILIQSNTQDTRIKFVVHAEHHDKFTTHIHNRLLAVFRKHYENVVLFELECAESKRKRDLDKIMKLEEAERLEVQKRLKERAARTTQSVRLSARGAQWIS